VGIHSNSLSNSSLGFLPGSPWVLLNHLKLLLKLSASVLPALLLPLLLLLLSPSLLAALLPTSELLLLFLVLPLLLLPEPARAHIVALPVTHLTLHCLAYTLLEPLCIMTLRLGWFWPALPAATDAAAVQGGLCRHGANTTDLLVLAAETSDRAARGIL
jgi:hypothetical protein